jgi:hypothetical protein
VAQVFGFSLAVAVDGEQLETDQQQDDHLLQPLPLRPLKVMLRTASAAAAAAARSTQRHVSQAVIGRVGAACCCCCCCFGNQQATQDDMLATAAVPLECVVLCVKGCLLLVAC